MSTSSGLSLMDFTAYEIPPERWLKFVSPKMRLRVRSKRRNFVSPVVKVEDRTPDSETDTTCTCTYWHWDDEQFSRPFFADDEPFEIEIERRFLLWYKCIRRTKQVTIDQVRTGDCDYCTLSLYDGEHSTGELEDKIEIGKVTFTVLN